MDLSIVKNMINTDEYEELIQKLTQTCKIEIDNREPSLQNLNMSAMEIDKAGIQTEDLMALALAEQEKFINFAKKKFKGTSKIEEEFPEGEEQDILSREEQNIIMLPYSKCLLIRALVEFHILANNPENLGKFIKSIGFSTKQGKIYEKEIKSFYDGI